MNNNFSVNRLAGHWIVQSSYCPSVQGLNFKNLFVNQVQWTYVKDCNLYHQRIRKHMSKDSRFNSISMYRIECSVYQKCNNVYYLAFIRGEPGLELAMRFDQNFRLLNRSIVQAESGNGLTFISSRSDITIIEKMYFLNHNLKVSKSTIQLYHNCVGTAFSSEIRIG